MTTTTNPTSINDDLPQSLYLIPYSQMDCGEYCEYVLNHHFKIRCTIPKKSSASAFGMTKSILRHKDCVAKKVTAPVSGDICMMMSGQSLHMGIYFSDNTVLHSDKHLIYPMRQSIAKIIEHYTIEGYYRITPINNQDNQ